MGLEFSSIIYFRDIKSSLFISELEKGRKLAQFMMQKLPHIIPFSEVGTPQSLKTLLLRSKANTMSARQPCYGHTKMYRSYRKMPINGHFSIKSIHFCLVTTFWIRLKNIILKTLYNEPCYIGVSM